MISAADLLLTTPYSRVQLFSGGGARFGYYLGSYAALCAHDCKPDLILASCGGSLAALLVDIAPDPKQLYLLAQSHQLYQAVQAIQARQYAPQLSSNQPKKPRHFYQALQRWRLMQQSTHLTHIHNNETHDQLLTELQHLAMFSIDNDASWLDELITLKENLSFRADFIPDIAIIASRLVSKHNPHAAATLQEVLFTPPKITQIIKQNPYLYSPSHNHAPQRIAKDIHHVNEWNITQAVRASMADMYYLQPTHIPSLGWSLGGVINLTPIELACQLGDTVFAETKTSYDTFLAAPAIKRIFGFDPNVRLNEVLAYQGKSFHHIPNHQHIHWLPFADNGKSLAGQHVGKRLNFRRGSVDLIHADYDGFVRQMQAQWQYGYERTINYLRVSMLNKR